MSKNELFLRIISSIAILALVLSCLIFEWAFCCLMLALAVGMLVEWKSFTRGESPFVGTFICLTPAISLCLLRNRGFWDTMIYFNMLWAVDVFAFVGGKILKGPKLLPSISPNKTWSGLIVAALGCLTIALIYKHFGYLNKDFASLIAFSIVFTLLAQAGDLLVSKYKRMYGVKDTGKLIPGHGGLLDRLDGSPFTAPTFLIAASWLMQ